jgi:hypothetical protein
MKELLEKAFGNSAKGFYFFLASLFVIQMIQGAFTRLWDDEAYYWLYGQFLDWGYYDHPPMIALSTRLSGFLSTELGVRIINIFLFILNIYLIYKILNPNDITLFIALLLSCVPVLVSGFLAIPDIPLLLFVTCFLGLYKNFLEEKTSIIGLSLCLAAMLYSKYHGVLVIGLVVLSNFSLFKNFKFYIIALLALLLFSPHILWQVSCDFPSLKYHLIERNSSFRWARLLEYPLGQLAIFGPLTGWLLLWGSTQIKATSTWDKTLRNIIWGVLIFFGLSAFKGRVEANWTLIIWPALMILSYHFFEQFTHYQRFLYKSLPWAILLQIGVRAIMIWPIVPYKYFHKVDFGSKQWAAKIDSLTGDVPVIFAEHYHLASLYSYYSATKMAGAYPIARKSQFSIWKNEFQQPFITTKIPHRQLVSYSKDSLWLISPVILRDFDKTFVDTEKGQFYLKKLSQNQYSDNIFLKNLGLPSPNY